VCSQLGLFTQKKRGFNPPLAPWLRRELRPRLTDLGPRLARITAHQLESARVTRLVDAFLGGEEGRAEQVLQLLILDTSLHQLLHGTHRVH
jgi:asparagine synthase (glutamine-hydrolysing)